MTSIYDVAIIGGGVVGAGLYRDLALHGLKTILIERGDFSAQTSQASSKMLHGGIRYLEQFHFSLVGEALREKHHWLNLTPHLTRKENFYFPVYKDSRVPPWKLAMGIFLYQFLAKELGETPLFINKDKLLSLYPHLHDQGLKGAGVYTDAIMDDAQIALECIWDANIERNSESLNHTEVTKVHKNGPLYTVETCHRLNGQKHSYQAKNVVYTLGPFTDQVLNKIAPFNWNPVLLPSKGVHLWFSPDQLTIEKPMVIQESQKRIVFVIPQKNKILVGTTETEPDENFFQQKVSEQDRIYLLKLLNTYFPTYQLEEKHIQGEFAGVRPLVRQEGGDRHNVSREHKVFRPQLNSYVIVGGKYTTFRTMVQEVAEELVLQSGQSYNPLKTLSPLRKKSHYSFFSSSHDPLPFITQILKEEQVGSWEDLVFRRLGLPVLDPVIKSKLKTLRGPKIEELGPFSQFEQRLEAVK